MERIPKTPPVVDPLPAAVPRPLWSVMIPVYNCSAFLEATLRSVLIQDPGEDFMQIEVIDDGSTDADVAELVYKVGKGRIGYYRQPRNVGSVWNFYTCISLARGKLVHILHGDDKVRYGFYHRLQLLFEQHPTMGAAFCRYAYINEHDKVLFNQPLEMSKPGILENWLETLGERQRIQYVAMVVKREVYEHLGSFYAVEYGEDWEMWMRIAAHYPTGYVPEVLAEYRRHSRSISGRSFLTGRNIRELQTVMTLIDKHLPEKHRHHIRARSRTFYAHYALKTAKILWKDFKHRSGAVAQIRAAWELKKDFVLFLKITGMYIRMALNI
jgi:glycosyltransferase involved in cell wall biosynthesis